MLIASRVAGSLCGLALLLPLAATAQTATSAPQPQPQPGIGSLLAAAEDLLLRMPDAQADGLFQVLLAISRHESDRTALCRVLEPEADRSLQSMSALAGRLSPEGREALANAIAEAVVMAMQTSTPAPWDRAAAEQALRANAVRAGLLHEGFSQGMAEGASSQARCQSLAWMLETIAERPAEERVLLMRLLLVQGLSQLG